MKISRAEVEHVAKLARLKLSEEELEKFTHQLGAILEYMDKLNELDTSEVEPTSHVLPLKNVFREDEVRVEEPRPDYLTIAPEASHGHFKVPKVIE